MNHLLRRCTVFCLVASMTVAAVAGTGLDPAIPQQVMLRVTAGLNDSAFISQFLARWPGTSVIRSIPSRKVYLLMVPPNQEATILNDLATNYVNPNPSTSDPNRPVSWASFNYQSETGEGRTGTIYVKTPPDKGRELIKTQYALPLMGVGDAQARTTGQAVLVAVLDTGVDSAHEALAGRVMPGYNEINANTDTSDVSQGIDSDHDGLVDEMVGHGTFLAGLIVNTAPSCRILPVKVLDSNGIGDLFTIAQGMFYAIDRGSKVINMSLSSTSDTRLIRDACYEAANLGIVVVAAAGNMNRSSPPEFPAFGSDVVGVAATDFQDHRATFSNFGQGLIACAPGASDFDPNTHEYYAERCIFGPLPGGAYGIWQGTSMSTAFTSGAVALLRAQHPEWAPNRQTFTNIVNSIAGTCADIEPLNPGFDSALGNGRIQMGVMAGFGPAHLPLGDLNADYLVDWVDLAQMLSVSGKVHSSADLDCSGRVDMIDTAILLASYGLVATP